MRLRRFLPLLPLLLGACTAPDPVTVIETRLIERHVPAALLTCPGVPEVAPDLSTQGAVGAALAEAVTGWRTCAGRLGQVRTLLRAGRSNAP